MKTKKNIDCPRIQKTTVSFNRDGGPWFHSELQHSCHSKPITQVKRDDILDSFILLPKAFHHILRLDGLSAGGPSSLLSHPMCTCFGHCIFNVYEYTSTLKQHLSSIVLYFRNFSLFFKTFLLNRYTNSQDLKLHSFHPILR